MTRVSQVQMKKLLDLLSEDGVMVQGKVMYTDTSRQCFWKKVAVQLNSIDGGAFKNAFTWCKDLAERLSQMLKMSSLIYHSLKFTYTKHKYFPHLLMWADWKNKTKRKADVLLKKKKYEFMPQPLPLTNLELRLLHIICYPMNDNFESHFEMMHKEEICDDVKADIGFTGDESNDSHINNGKGVTDEEDNKALRFFARHKRKADYHKSDLLDDVSDDGKRMKTNENKAPSSSFEEFKIRTTLELEKEKSQQKNEELRLRAIELKLKGEELKIKEAEINKVNYLTSIEEEKLKCLKEISASLKELLARNRSENLRFNNVI